MRDETGCAAIMTGTTTTISITSMPPGATAAVYPAKTISVGWDDPRYDRTGATIVTGRSSDVPVAIVTTPDQLILSRHRETYVVEFEHETAGNGRAALCSISNQSPWVWVDVVLLAPKLVEALFAGLGWPNSLWDWRQVPVDAPVNWHDNPEIWCGYHSIIEGQPDDETRARARVK